MSNETTAAPRKLFTNLDEMQKLMDEFRDLTERMANFYLLWQNGEKLYPFSSPEGHNPPSHES